MRRLVLAHRAAVRVAAILLAFTIGGGSFHASWDDACDAQPTLHDHAAHRFGSDLRRTAQPEHCALCHSLRLLGGGLVAIAGTTVEPGAARTFAASTIVVPSTLLSSSDPTRGPPASSL